MERFDWQEECCRIEASGTSMGFFLSLGLGWEIGEPPNPAAGRSLEIDGEIDETSVTRY